MSSLAPWRMLSLALVFVGSVFVGSVAHVITGSCLRRLRGTCYHWLMSSLAPWHNWCLHVGLAVSYLCISGHPCSSGCRLPISTCARPAPAHNMRGHPWPPLFIRLRLVTGQRINWATLVRLAPVRLQGHPRPFDVSSSLGPPLFVRRHPVPFMLQRVDTLEFDIGFDGMFGLCRYASSCRYASI